MGPDPRPTVSQGPCLSACFGPSSAQGSYGDDPMDHRREPKTNSEDICRGVIRSVSQLASSVHSSFATPGLFKITFHRALKKDDGLRQGVGSRGAPISVVRVHCWLIGFNPGRHHLQGKQSFGPNAGPDSQLPQRHGPDGVRTRVLPDRELQSAFASRAAASRDGLPRYRPAP